MVIEPYFVDEYALYADLLKAKGRASIVRVTARASEDLVHSVGSN